MKTLEEKIEIMQAALDGKELEIDTGGGFRGLGFKSDECVFNWQEYDYRIKPEPLEFWVLLVTDSDRPSIVNETKEYLQDIAKSNGTENPRIIKVREVTDE